MVTQNNSLTIKSALERILVYAKNPTDLPLLIRTDSVVTSDILRDAIQNLVEDSRLDLPCNVDWDENLCIIYNYVTSITEEALLELIGKKCVIIVDGDYEPIEEVFKYFDFVDCFNDKAMTVTALYAVLKTLPEELYIFAREDFSKGLLPIKLNQVTPGVVGYGYSLGKLRRVRQMLDELEPISSSDRAVIYHNAFFTGIEDYDPEDDYAVIELESRDKCVDNLVNFFRQRK